MYLKVSAPLLLTQNMDFKPDYITQSKSHHQLQDALDVSLATQALVHMVCFHISQSHHQLQDALDVALDVTIDMCLCCQANVYCILQLMMTLLHNTGFQFSFQNKYYPKNIKNYLGRN